MKILVIDDRQENLEGAKKVFAGHELTTITDCDSAVEALHIQYDKKKQDKLKEEGMDFFESREKSKLPFSYDIVITDLMLPASDYMLSDKHKYAGQEMPIGLILAILAARNGAKKVILVTNMDHHQHPMSAAIDHIDEGSINIAGAEVIFMQAPDYRPKTRALGLKDWESVKKTLKKINGE